MSCDNPIHPDACDCGHEEPLCYTCDKACVDGAFRDNRGRPFCSLLCQAEKRRTREVPIHTVKCPACGELLVTLALIEGGHTCRVAA